jgi:hypothetical protein
MSRTSIADEDFVDLSRERLMAYFAGTKPSAEICCSACLIKHRTDSVAVCVSFFQRCHARIAREGTRHGYLYARIRMIARAAFVAVEGSPGYRGVRASEPSGRQQKAKPPRWNRRHSVTVSCTEDKNRRDAQQSRLALVPHCGIQAAPTSPNGPTGIADLRYWADRVL